jgi:hypothetical protein
MKCLVIDFELTKRFQRVKGKHSVVYELYFIRIWLLKDSYLDTIKKSHDQGVREGVKEAAKFLKN